MENSLKAEKIVSSMIEYDPYGDSTSRKEAFECTLKALEWKDKMVKRFLVEHIAVDYTGETDEFGNPVNALDYVDFLDKRMKAAQEMYDCFIEFCNREDVE